MVNKTFIFDFDSTFIRCEGFDALLESVLDKDERGQELIKEFKAITDKSMRGQYSFSESLRERLSMLKANQQDIINLSKHLKTQITPSFQLHKAFFDQYKDHIYVISGGFMDYIWPVIKDFGFHRKNVFANELMYDINGRIKGFDASNVLSQDQGKVKLLQTLNLGLNTVMVGDGYNDYETKAANQVGTFFAFTENVYRKEVVKIADGELKSLDDLFVFCDIPAPKKSKLKALLLENVHPSVKQNLEAQGYVVEEQAKALDGEALNTALKGVHLLGIRSKSKVDAKTIEGNNSLIAIGAFCIGVNQINLSKALEKGICVFNAPFSNTRSVVELALSHIISLIRRSYEKSVMMHQGKWFKSAKGAFEVRGKTLGIIGYGNIGSQLSILAENMGMKVIFYDLEYKMPLGNATPYKSLSDVLKQSDVISLHVDGRSENKNIIGANEINQMKQGAGLINLSRGHVMELDAVHNALNSKHLCGVAIDVFPEEPQKSDCEFTHPLQKFNNAILTPHIGGSTLEAQAHIGETVSSHLINFVQSGDTASSVNFPKMTTPPTNGAQRIIHIHKNVPGMLAQINQCLANHNINIVGQALKTREGVGYALTDVIEGYQEALITELGNIKHTITVRVID